MTREKFQQDLAKLLNSVRIMGTNLEDTLDKVIKNLAEKMFLLQKRLLVLMIILITVKLILKNNAWNWY